MEYRKLPIGYEFFKDIREQNCYYVDKTPLIAELLQYGGQVNLFTRPRRFGKTLNMDMLRCFFEIGQDRAMFDDLAIAQKKELCEQHMGRYPVLFISLKGVNGRDFQSAKKMLCSEIGTEIQRFSYLLESPLLSEADKEYYRNMLRIGYDGYEMSDTVLTESLRKISELLYKHHAQKVILLIDEYDVPLDKAYHGGYYEEMIVLIRNLLNQALKTNRNLFLAVLTGCLRVSKESIFTGLNNVQVHTISDALFDKYFGFTEEEVMEMLRYYGAEHKADSVREWYDGYRFGNTGIYCPWDVINFCCEFSRYGNAEPKSYWINTSGNDIIRKLIAKANSLSEKHEIESLLAGETIQKQLNPELTYAELDSSSDNLWSFLYATGYLTMQGEPSGENRDIVTLTIPNREIQIIFKKQIYEWFNDTAYKEPHKLAEFCDLFPAGNAAAIEEMFNGFLAKTISIRDTSVERAKKENFYHGYLLGLLRYQDNWILTSNTESGNGYCDILIRDEIACIGIIIEVKYAENNRLDEQCAKALQQIEEKHYEQSLLDDGYTTIMKYGIACYKKRCKVVLA